MRKITPLLSCLAGCLLGAHAAAQQAPKEGESLGELLYSTHCNACHTAQVHWRDRRLATDWASLGRQVRRWQANSGLGWSEDEIAEVMRYLNRRYYGFPEAGPQMSRDSSAGPRAHR